MSIFSKLLKGGDELAKTLKALDESGGFEQVLKQASDPEQGLGPRTAKDVNPAKPPPRDSLDGPADETVETPEAEFIPGPKEEARVDAEAPAGAAPDDEVPAGAVPDEEVPAGAIPDEERFPPATVEEAGETAEAAQRPATGEPEVTNINFDRVTDGEAIEQMVDQVARQIEAPPSTTVDEMGKGGEKLLDEGEWTIEKALDWNPESGLPIPKKVAANRTILLTLGRQLKAEADSIFKNRGAVGDEELAMFRMNVAKYRAFLEVVQGQTRMASQMLNQFKYVVEDIGLARIQGLEEILDDTGGRKAAISLAKLLSEEAADPKVMVKHVRNAWWRRSMKAIEAYRYNAMLSGISTQERNLLGNALALFVAPAERAAGAAVSGVRRGVRKALDKPAPRRAATHDGIRASESVAMLYGSVSAIPEALSTAFKALKDPTFSPGGTKLDEPPASIIDFLPEKMRQRAGETENVVARGIRSLTDLLLFNLAPRMLQSGDVFFKALNFRAETNAITLRIAKNEGLQGDELIKRVKEIAGAEKMPSDVFQHGYDAANLNTFTNQLGQVGRWGQQIRQRIPPLKVVIPFYKTLVNIGVYTGRRTVPANVMGALMPETREMLARGGAEADEYYGRAAMWGVLGGMGALLAANGQITGTGACLSEKTRNNWRKAGWRPNSIVNDDGTYTELRAGAPVTTIMSYYASLGECHSFYDDPMYEDAVASKTTMSAFLLAEVVMSQTFAAGLLTYLDALVKPADYKGKRISKDFLGQYWNAPRWLTQFEVAEDPAYTQTDIGSTLEDLNAQFWSRMPGGNDEYPARITFFGDEATSPSGPFGVFPTRPVQKGWDLLAHMIENGVAIVEPKRRMRLAGATVDLMDLNPDDPRGGGWVFHDWAKILGEERFDALNDLLDLDEYASAMPGVPGSNPEGEDTRGDLINKAMSAARKSAMERMIADYEGTMVGDLFARELSLATPQVAPMDPGSRKRFENEEQAMAEDEGGPFQ